MVFDETISRGAVFDETISRDVPIRGGDSATSSLILLAVLPRTTFRNTDVTRTT
jgi:hypothetical protein